MPSYARSVKVATDLENQSELVRTPGNVAIEKSKWEDWNKYLVLHSVMQSTKKQ